MTSTLPIFTISPNQKEILYDYIVSLIVNNSYHIGDTEIPPEWCSLYERHAELITNEIIKPLTGEEEYGMSNETTFTWESEEFFRYFITRHITRHGALKEWNKKDFFIIMRKIDDSFDLITNEYL